MRVFEIARVFSKGSDGRLVLKRTYRRPVVRRGHAEQWGEKTRNVDFYDIKADVENLLKNKAAEVRQNRTSCPAFRARCQYRFRLPSYRLCRRIASEWLQKYDLPQALLVFEIDMAAVLEREKTRPLRRQ